MAALGGVGEGLDEGTSQGAVLKGGDGGDGGAAGGSDLVFEDCRVALLEEFGGAADGLGSELEGELSGEAAEDAAIGECFGDERDNRRPAAGECGDHVHEPLIGDGLDLAKGGHAGGDAVDVFWACFGVGEHDRHSLCDEGRGVAHHADDAVMGGGLADGFDGHACGNGDQEHAGCVGNGLGQRADFVGLYGEEDQVERVIGQIGERGDGCESRALYRVDLGLELLDGGGFGIVTHERGARLESAEAEGAAHAAQSEHADVEMLHDHLDVAADWSNGAARVG